MTHISVTMIKPNCFTFEDVFNANLMRANNLKSSKILILYMRQSGPE